MKGQVMIYVISRSANENALDLFNEDFDFFYWNDNKFKNLTIGDYVFVVNRTSKWVLFSTLDKIDIETSENGESTTFSDSGKNFIVSGKYNKFIRLKIHNKLSIPINWDWKELGAGENTYLNGKNINITSSDNRLTNINQLLQLSQDETITQILENCRLNFNGSTTKSTPIKNVLKDKIDKVVSFNIGNGKKMKDIISEIESYIKSKGYNFKNEEIANFYLSLKTKPFVILAGISGTGKTQLPRLFAESVGMEKEQVIQIPVRPDWTDASDLIGYTSLNNQFISKPLTDAIVKAKEESEKPFFFILDEMNLARVEHYFADFLSIIETRTHKEGKIITDALITESQIKDAINKDKFEGLFWPENLYLIGTVNMDETTHPFSRKVLDRANSIEMNNVELNWLKKSNAKVEVLAEFKNDLLRGSFIGSKDLSDEDKKNAEQVLEELIEINKILKIADLHFAYRVRDEIIFYITYAKKEDLLTEKQAMDFQLMQKILPRLHGSSIRTQKVLVELINKFASEKFSPENPPMIDIQKNKANLINKSSYPKSLEKLIFMLERFDEDRFTSFWV